MINKPKKSIQQRKSNLQGKAFDKKFFVRAIAFSLLAIFVIGNLPGLKVDAAATYTGRVFQDFNGNGTYDTDGGTIDAPNAIDTGVAGAVVTAFDSAGVQQGTATSTADGTYSLAAAGTGPYRLEFTPPPGFLASARSANSLFTATATTAGSSAQFTDETNVANINFAVNRPEEYCQNNPDLVTCRYNLGAQNGTFANSPVLQNFAYDAGTVYTDTTVANYDAPTAHTLSVPSSSIGSVFGLAYSRATRRIYAAAFYKRNSGFGPGANGTFDAAPSTTSDEPGAVYLINPATNTKVGTFTVPGATNNNHSTTAAADTTDASFDAVGKTGLGGIALADDESRLFVMNLQNNTLYALNPTTGAALTPTAGQVVPTPTGAAACPTADVRPFAVKYYRGNLYVGMVCSAQSTAAAANLRAYVYQVNPTTLAFGATPYTFSLNYNRGFANDGAANTAEWRPWFATAPTANFSYPQPMLTDIEFDNGNMVLGIRDRYGDQGLENSVRPGGETLRSCGDFTAANFPGTLTLEANGRCGGGGTAPQNTGQGPGAAPGTAANSGEYYFQDDFSTPANGANYHDEVSLGGLTRIPGYGQTVSTIFDPIARPVSDQVHDGGFRWFDNATGTTTKAYRIYDGNGDPATTPDFGKANGLGDIIPLCNSAPIEIGNRVWRDTNGNGVQDPQESRAVGTAYVSLAGITVRLYNAANVLVGTAVTDQDGEYYFTSGTAADGDLTDNIGIVNGGILPNAAYQIRFDEAANYAAGGVLAGTVLTRADATQQAGIDDASDSDAVRVTNPVNSPTAGTFPVINYTTGAAGSNDHTLDVGFAAPVSIGSTVFNDANNNGLLDTGETGFAGVAVELLYDANNDGVIDGAELTTPVATTTTSTGTGATLGNYFFGGLTPGNYQVRIPTPPSGFGLSSAPAVTDTADNQQDNDDNGSQTTAGGAVLSPVINLTVGAEPLNAVETGQGGTLDDAATDANGDMTIDFGFVAPASVGNIVFNDLDRDGIQDTGEVGVNGVIVTLYDGAGNIVATTTTAGGGLYSFPNLFPGTYSVGFTRPNGFGFSPQDQGGNDALDSDANVLTGRTANFTLIAGQNNVDIDAGIFDSVSLGNRVFNDANNNGIFDTGDSAIANVTVNLYLDANNDGAPDGGIIRTVTTDANGLYLFDGLAPNTYIVGVVTPTGLTSSSVNGGDPDTNAADNDDNGVLVVGNETRSNPVTLTIGGEPTGEAPNNDPNTADNRSNLTVDFGFTAAYSLGNRVWFDTNNNGQLNTGEVGIANVSVSVFASGDLVNAVGTVTTDANGYYRFDNLGSGTYVVRINPSNFVTGGALFGYQNTTGATATDVDSTNTLGGEDGINPTGAANTIQTLGISSGIVTLGGAAEPTGETDVQASGQGAVDNQANMTIDFGFYRLSLSGTVFNDTGAGALNNNGTFDTATETGNAGAIVRLYDSAGNEVLVGPDGILGTADDAAGGTVTNAAGGYAFSGLAPGDYTVRVTPPAGTLSSLNTAAAPDPDNNTANDDNGAPGTGAAAGTIVSLPITLTAGGEPTVTNGTGSTANATLDFGLISSYSLGNRVWFDTNNDGLINAGELGISGVSVSAFADTNGDGVIDTTEVAVGTVTTDANGYYRFDNLTSGNYIVRINPANFANGAVLAGYQNTTATVNNDTTDSTATAGQNGENGINPTGAANTVQTNGIISTSIVLGPAGGTEAVGETDVLGGTVAGQGTLDAQANMTIDFGFYRMSLSGTVWNDLNNNGAQNGTEPGIANIRVQIFLGTTTTEILVGPDGILGTSDDAANGMLTSSTGGYNFQGLPPGTYRVVITPNGATSSTLTVTDPNGNIDNDDNGFPNTNEGFPGRIISGTITLTPAGEVTATNAGGLTLNPTVDFGLVSAPTVVKLDAFEAFTDGDSVELRWSTGDEAGNLGFNVYREANGKRQLLNSAPIAGNALRSSAELVANGSDYTWTDKETVPGAVYYLEDLDVDGSANLNGAVTPQSRQTLGNQPNARMFTDLAKTENSSGVKEIVNGEKVTVPNGKDSAAAMVRQQQIAALGGAKLIVNHDGWYRVSAQQLQAAGFDANSNSQLWQLFVDGSEVPFKLNSDDSIEFYGRGLNTPLTDKQVYYLINGQTNGLRINAVEGGSAGDNADARTFDVSVERKDRAVYVPRILNGDEDNWFGAVVNRSNQTVQNLTVVNADANGQAHLSVKLQGLVAVEHAVNVRFNDVPLGTVEFSGFENKQFEFDLPAGAIREGVNSVYLQANGASSDTSLVDTIRLDYRRGYTAGSDRLRFSVPANQSVRVDGFTNGNISVYEIRGGAARQQVVGASGNVEGNFGFSLAAANADREMIAVASGSVEQASVEKNVPSAWNNAGNEADFVIVTANELSESAVNLATMRQAQGLKTKVVLVDDLFDEFSFGRRDPNAVKQFLKTATTKWATKPQYALLFGDSSYDARNNLGLSVTRDRVPTKSVDTETMETSSDSWLADFDNDGAEDIALGRLPVGNASEAAAAVEKLARFDAQSARLEKTNVLVADSGFEDYSVNLQTLLPRDVISFRVDRSAMTDAETHQNIVEQLNRNPLLVTYTGHGSQSVWAASSVFNSTDAAGLTNNKLSFYLLMNCLNGYTHQPTGESLAEVLFKSPNGAVAVWTSSGATQPGSQAVISQAFTNFAFNAKAGKSLRIGDVTKAAKRASGDTDVRRTWQLIGDPTVFIR